MTAPARPSGCKGTAGAPAAGPAPVQRLCGNLRSPFGGGDTAATEGGRWGHRRYRRRVVGTPPLHGNPPIRRKAYCPSRPPRLAYRNGKAPPRDFTCCSPKAARYLFLPRRGSFRCHFPRVNSAGNRRAHVGIDHTGCVAQVGAQSPGSRGFALDGPRHGQRRDCRVSAHQHAHG